MHAEPSPRRPAKGGSIFRRRLKVTSLDSGRPIKARIQCLSKTLSYDLKGIRREAGILLWMSYFSAAVANPSGNRNDDFYQLKWTETYQSREYDYLPFVKVELICGR